MTKKLYVDIKQDFFKKKKEEISPLIQHKTSQLN